MLMERRSLGGVSITDMSRKPNNDMCRVLGNGRGAHADDVDHGFLELLEALLVFHAEALLFVDNHLDLSLGIPDILREQTVRADGQIDLAFGQIRHRGLEFLG